MHIACANGYTSILEFLLIDCQLAVESGAPLIGPSVLSTDNDGWTPLHVATFWGHVSLILVRFLVYLDSLILSNLKQ